MNADERIAAHLGRSTMSLDGVRPESAGVKSVQGASNHLAAHALGLRDKRCCCFEERR